MADRDYSPLSAACVRTLIDKQPEKRKAAACEIEKMVKEFIQTDNTTQIRKLLKVLGQDFTLSQNINFIKGGLKGLASVAVTLGKDAPDYTESLIRPILTRFVDNDLRVRYLACESLYNVIKVARGAVLPYFTDIFNGLCKLAADPDQDVKKACECLDRMMKDIVTESATFDLVHFIPHLREKMYSNNSFARQYVISWISVLDSVPDILLIQFLPEILDGLFYILGDNDLDIKKMCETVLNKFLISIKNDPSEVDFISMINVLIVHAQAPEELKQSMAISWISVLVELSGKAMLPFTSGIISAVLPCLAYEGDSRMSIKETAKSINGRMMNLVSDEKNSLELVPDQEEDNSVFYLVSVLDTLKQELFHVAVPTKVAALLWIYHLHDTIPKRMLKHVNSISPLLLKVLSDDNSDEVVQNVLHVIALIISPEIREQPSDQQPSLYFKNFLISFLKLFKMNGQLLEDRGSFIIRQLCVLLNAEDVYQSTAAILKEETDIKFAALMVDTLNYILLTSSELFDLRNLLKNAENKSLFVSLYETWCHNPIATVALCLLTQNYAHTCDLIFVMSNYEVTVELLADIDRLIQLLESPIFVHLRLQLLEVPANSYLIRAMYGILMMLPQSDAFHVLRHRLDCIPKLPFPLTDGDELKTKPKKMQNKYDLNFNQLKDHFISMQEIHKKRKLAARVEVFGSKN